MGGNQSVEEPDLENVQGYTLEDVAKHNKNDNIWIVLDGKVIDVTNFLSDHPGGRDILMSVAGEDASQNFIKYGHSSSARSEAYKLLVGKVVKAKPSQ